MTRLVVEHTGRLTPGDLDAVRDLLVAAFVDGFSETDLEHCLGGLHALLWEGPELLAHGALVQRRLLHGGRALRAGYVEGVAVRADARRQGHGGAVVAALEDIGRRAYDVLALSTTDEGDPFYASRGWLPWQVPTAVLTVTGPVRTPDDDDAVRVLPLSAPLHRSGELTCDWRDGDPW